MPTDEVTKIVKVNAESLRQIQHRARTNRKEVPRPLTLEV
jgi:hypothetical protein